MENNKIPRFSEARVWKCKIEYYKYPFKEIKYSMSFTDHTGFNEWINKRVNRDKVVTQMLIRYDYPDERFPIL